MKLKIIGVAVLVALAVAMLLTLVGAAQDAPAVADDAPLVPPEGSASTENEAAWKLICPFH